MPIKTSAPTAIEASTTDRFAVVHADFETETHYVIVAPGLVNWWGLEELLGMFGLEMMDEDECASEPVMYGWVKVWCAERTPATGVEKGWLLTI